MAADPAGSSRHPGRRADGAWVRGRHHGAQQNQAPSRPQVHLGGLQGRLICKGGPSLILESRPPQI